MEKINYTLNLEDCRDYVKYQRKIPRIRKFIMKQFRPFLYICLGLILFSFLFEIINIVMSLNSVAAEYSMSFIGVVKSYFFWPMVSAAFEHFWEFNIPVILIWLVVFWIAWTISKYDLFHAESSRVYDVLKGQDLDITITPQDDGLLCSGKLTTTLYKWQKIIDVYDTNKSFLVFVGDYAALVIPKRAFETPEEEKIFFNYLNEKLDQK